MLKWIRKKICCFRIKKYNLNNNINNNLNNNLNNIEYSSTNLEKKERMRMELNDSIFISNNSYLTNITYKETTIFIPEIRFAKVIKVYDGDTITVASKLPFNESPIYRFSVRLRSIDSPEIRGKSKKECNLAIKSRDALHNLIFGKIIELKNNGKEKYGRLLADIYYNDIHINKWMVDEGYAVKYDGGNKIRGIEWD
jgi:micrococcal nuclease